MTLLQSPSAKRVFCTLWCLSWLIIAVLLLRPLPFNLPSGSDVIGHFALFGIMSLGIISFAARGLQIILLAGITVSLGVVLEFGQAYVPSRYFDVADLVANILGGTIGGLLAHWIFRNWTSTRSIRDAHS